MNGRRNFGSKHRLSTYFVSVVLNEPAERTRRVFSLVGVLFLALSLYAFLLYMGLIYSYCATRYLITCADCHSPKVYSLLSLVAMDSLRIITCSLTDGRPTNMSFKRRHFFYTPVVDCRECRNTSQLSCSKKSIFYLAIFGLIFRIR